ncbi:MAG: nuclear transport factor 2 family protein [Cyanobacteria bacterium J06641_2]
MKRVLTAFIFTALVTVVPASMTSANSQDEVLLVNGFKRKSRTQREIRTFDSVNDIVPRSRASRIGKQFLQLFEAQDTNAISQLWTEDATIELPYDLQGRNFPNREAAQGYVEGAVALFSEIRFEQIRLYETRNPNVVVVEAQGDFVVAENGRPYRNNYVFVFQTSGNKVKFIREYFNPLIIARTFGIDVTPNQTPD